MTDRDDVDAQFAAFAASAMPALRRTGYLICGDWHRAEDAVQETLLKVYRSWARIERRESAHGYARRTLVRALIDQGRRPWRRERPVAEAFGDVVGTDGPEATVTDRAALAQALAGLTPRRRACVVLRHYHDLSVAETAEILGCSAGTVKSQTHVALHELRALVREDELVCGRTT